MMDELINRDDYDFSILLGDLINDSIALFDPLKKLLLQSDKPYKAVYGNHDRDMQADHTNQSQAYNTYFGPTNYAFYHHNTLFITLNSLVPVGKYGYKEMYTQAQLDFVQNVLSTMADDQLIVINQHIPLGWMKNRQDLIALLNRNNEVLVLSGHSHSVMRRSYDRPGLSPIQELTCGAVSGNWWTGQKDYQGIPMALMKCGTPRGYYVIDIDQSDYTLTYKGLGLPNNHQLNVWFGPLDNMSLPNLLQKDNSKAYINFYSGSDSTVIEASINGETIGVATREYLQPPFVSRIKSLQKHELSPDIWSKPAPYLNNPSGHIWVLDIPYDNLNLVNTLELKISDPHTTFIRQKFTFWKHR